jgi:NADPH:quinone reductase-like Zn-dependent oxidoreductase
MRGCEQRLHRHELCSYTTHMQAARVHEFGGPDVIVIDELPPPQPGTGEVLVRVHAAGVGPWDAWVRSGKSVLPQTLPLTLGSDLSGVIVELGANVEGFELGQEVFGVTNRQFTGAYAQLAVVNAKMISRKPASLDHVHCAGIPVVAVTALQMVVDIAKVAAGQRVLVLGAGGNVGAYAVQIARLAGAHVVGADLTRAIAYAGEVGANEVVDTSATPIERATTDIDVVIDTVGGELAERALSTVKAGGLLISSVARPKSTRADVRTHFMLVDVTSHALEVVAGELERGRLVDRLGCVLPLVEARTAHEMLAGAGGYHPGKTVLDVAAVPN